MTSPDQVDAAREQCSYEPWFQLASTLGTEANWLVNDAAYLRGRVGAGKPLDITDLRARVADMACTLAAYDAAIAAGKVKVTNEEWSALRKGGRPAHQDPRHRNPAGAGRSRSAEPVEGRKRAAQLVEVDSAARTKGCAGAGVMSAAADRLKTERAEVYLREILRIASAGQIDIATAGDLVNGIHGRAALLTALSEIKINAIAAEVLLRSCHPFAGVAQPSRAPDASHQEVASSNLAPRSTLAAGSKP